MLFLTARGLSQEMRRICGEETLFSHCTGGGYPKIIRCFNYKKPFFPLHWGYPSPIDIFLTSFVFSSLHGGYPTAATLTTSSMHFSTLHVGYPIKLQVKELNYVFFQHTVVIPHDNDPAIQRLTFPTHTMGVSKIMH